jgi:hypothetical protein
MGTVSIWRIGFSGDWGRCRTAAFTEVLAGGEDGIAISLNPLIVTAFSGEMNQIWNFQKK